MSWQSFLKSLLKSYNVPPRVLAQSYRVSVSYIYHMLNGEKTAGSYQKVLELIRFLRNHGVRQDLLANLVYLIIAEKKQSKEIDKLEGYYKTLIPSQPTPTLSTDETTHIDAYIIENIRPLRLNQKKEIVMKINQFLLNEPAVH